jgi:3-methyladenine DNA glycosylase AlkD
MSSIKSRIPTSQVLRHLRALKPQNDPVFLARYVGAIGHEDRSDDERSQLRFLGLKVPQVDQILKLVDRDGVNSRALLTLARKATHHEELSILIALLDELDRRAPLRLRELEPFIAVIDNWATSDSLSSILARALEREGKAALPVYRKWNRSRNPWMRRQSLVGLYYYSSARKRMPPAKFVLEQLQSLLDDPHFYVQRGVGWTLRELHNVEPALQEAFVLRELARISSTAWFAASENYPKARKADLARARRAERAARAKSARKTAKN